MTEEKIKFLTDIVKPWEVLNSQLSKPFSVNTTISDFTYQAFSLAVSIKHFPESTHNFEPKDLVGESETYKIISDLANSHKHPIPDDNPRKCTLYAGSLFERNKEGLVRFLRNTINIKHNTFGDLDFLDISKKCALFIASKVQFVSDWTPNIIANKGLFSNKIHIHASIENQVAWQAMKLQFVELNDDGFYRHVDLNSTIEFTLTVDENLSIPK